MHGITKMQEYMTLFGSGSYFLWWTWRISTQAIYQNTRKTTQCKVSEFAQQTELQYYNMLVSSYAVHDCQIRSNFYKQSGNTGTDFVCTETKGEVVIEMSGKYDFTVTREVIAMIRRSCH
jgi:hypothetical protein